MTDECRAHVEAGNASWHHTAHDVLSIPVFAAAVLAPAAMAPSFADDCRRRRLFRVSAVAPPVLALLFVLGGIEVVPSWNGIVQRVAASAAFVWMAFAALELRRL